MISRYSRSDKFNSSSSEVSVLVPFIPLPVLKTPTTTTLGYQATLIKTFLMMTTPGYAQTDTNFITLKCPGATTLSQLEGGRDSGGADGSMIQSESLTNVMTLTVDM